MAWSKWVGGVAAFGVSFTALACTAEADLDESGEEQLSAQSANATTLACPGPSAFDTIPKGGKRAFVGGVMRFERSKCDSYGRCAPWTKVWETPITRTEESELRRETDGPEEQAKILWLGRAFAETWTAWEGGDSVKYSVYASAYGARVDAAGRGQFEGDQSINSYKGVTYGRRRTYGSYSTSYSDHRALYSLPMSIQVGSSCALLVQSVPGTEYVARGATWSLGNDGSRFRLVLKLDLEAASPAADGGTGQDGGSAAVDSRKSVCAVSCETNMKCRWDRTQLGNDICETCRNACAANADCVALEACVQQVPMDRRFGPGEQHKNPAPVGDCYRKYQAGWKAAERAISACTGY